MAEAREDPELWSKYTVGTGATDEIDNALASHLAETERVAYRLKSSGGVVHKLHDQTIERGDGTLCAVTDRQLVFVVEAGVGLETAAVPYTELTTIERESSLLRTKLAVSVWAHGTLRFRPDQSGTAEEVVQFVSEAIDRWQTAVAALQDAKQFDAERTAHVENGDVAAATDASQSIRENLRVAQRAAEGAEEMVARAIDERISSVDEELARSRMTVHFDRGRVLAPQAYNLAVAARYDEASETLERARSHVETAVEIARERGFSDRERIRSLRNHLEEVSAEIASSPLERAEMALDRARTATGVHAELRGWEHALSCYLDALTAGWGTDTFDGKTDALRVQVEWLVAQVIRTRRRLAKRYEADGDAFSDHGVNQLGVDRYETACAHLAAAARLADEFRAGDAAAIRDRFWWVATKTEDF